MISLFGNHGEGYKKFSRLSAYYSGTVNKDVVDIAIKRQFPDDERVLIGVHRMLVFDYYWSLMGTSKDSSFEALQSDVGIVEDEVCRLLNITPEQARKLADRKDGYRGHLHEEDAFICGELVDLYWNDPERTQLRNPGTCTKQYRSTVTGIKGLGNV